MNHTIKVGEIISVKLLKKEKKHRFQSRSDPDSAMEWPRVGPGTLLSPAGGAHGGP